MRVAFGDSIIGTHVLTYDDALEQTCLLHEQGVLEFSLTFSPKKKLSLKEVRKATNEYGLFYPNTRWDEDAALTQTISTSTTTEA